LVSRVSEINSKPQVNAQIAAKTSIKIRYMASFDFLYLHRTATVPKAVATAKNSMILSFGRISKLI
jgi:hypothetical protein